MVLHTLSMALYVKTTGRKILPLPQIGHGVPVLRVVTRGRHASPPVLHLLGSTEDTQFLFLVILLPLGVLVPQGTSRLTTTMLLTARGCGMSS